MLDRQTAVLIFAQAPIGCLGGRNLVARAQPAGRSKHQRAEVEHRAAGIGIESAELEAGSADLSVTRREDQAERNARLVVGDDGVEGDVTRVRAEGAMEDREMLEDLMVVAYADAFKQVEAASEKLMSGATAGMPMPPGFKLPF